MHVNYFLGASRPITPMGRAAVIVGVFDGMHAGHRRRIERTAEIAARDDARAVAVTFWPHPEAVLRPEAEQRLLTTLDERIALLRGLGLLDAVVVMPFIEELAVRPADALLDALQTFCEPLALIEGTAFALESGRAGDSTSLRATGQQRGLRVETLDEAEGGEHISSARIRALLGQGELEAANRLLGRPYSLSGEVVVGDRRGRLLGFPTANLRLDPRKALPANGVYAVRVGLPGETENGHPGVCNIGVRPTFGGEPRLLVEVHMLDATMDLYGLLLRVDLIARLRDERRFSGVDELKAQIAHDADTARALLAEPGAHSASAGA